jgi:hypothetical protein
VTGNSMNALPPPPVPLLALEVPVGPTVELIVDVVALVDEDDVDASVVAPVAPGLVVDAADLPPAPLDVSLLEQAARAAIAINAKDFFID